MTNRAHRLPEHIAGAVEHELARLGPVSGSDLRELLSVWADALGDAIARNSWPARVTRDGTLVVHTSSSAWAHELTHLVDTVRERLGPLAPPSLRFVVGPLPEPAAAPKVPRGEQPLHRVSPGDEAKAAEIAAAIEDSGLRAAVARAAALSLAAASSGRPAGPSGRL